MNNLINEEKIIDILPKSIKQNNDVVYLKEYWINDDINFEEDSDLEGKAELLINYLNKLEQAKEKVKYFKKCIDTITNILPENMHIRASNDRTYFIAKKDSDKDIIPYISFEERK